MALSNKKTTSTTTSNGTSTMTPTGPSWLTDFLQGNTSKATDLANADPQTYVAGQNAYQTNALNNVDKLTGSPWNFDNAAGAVNSVLASKNPLGVDYASAYTNPYKDQVLNAATADFDANAGKTRAQQALDIANAGAFGGSGAALTKSATEGELARARNSTVSGLLRDMFDTSQGLGQQDANRAIQTRAQRLQGAQQLADLSTSYDQNQRANAGALSTLGGQLQETQQKQAQAPLDLMTWLNSQGVDNNLLAQLFGKTVNTSETSTSTGQTKNNGINWGDWFGGNLQLAGQALTGGR